MGTGQSHTRRLAQGPSRFWAVLYRWRLARASMPFWRVVVEARPDRRARRWPAGVVSAVAPVFVWARTVEEAEALGQLALEAEGFAPITADAVKMAPAGAPRRYPEAIARGTIGFIMRREEDAQRGSSSLPSAKA